MYLENVQARRPRCPCHRRGAGDRAGVRRGAGRGRRHIVIADVNASVGYEARAAMKAKGYDVDFAEMDVTKSKQVDAVADDIVSRYGKIDILVNNAGIARSETPAETVTDEHWLNVLDVNLNGTFWCCRAFGRHMLAAKSGSIVNIGSMSGLHRQQAAGAGVLQRLESGRASTHEVIGGRVGRARRSRQRGRADLHQYAAQRVREGEPQDARCLDRRHADRTHGRGARSRRRRSFPGRQGRQPDDGKRRPRRRRLHLLVRCEPTVSTRPRASALKNRGIRTARGGRWHVSNVRNLLRMASHLS